MDKTMYQCGQTAAGILESVPEDHLSQNGAAGGKCRFGLDGGVCLLKHWTLPYIQSKMQSAERTGHIAARISCAQWPLVRAAIFMMTGRQRIEVQQL